MTPSKLSEKAKELAHELGAEAIVIIVLRPSADGQTWDAEHSAYLDTNTGLGWETLADVVAEAAEDMGTEPVIHEAEPS